MEPIRVSFMIFTCLYNALGRLLKKKKEEEEEEEEEEDGEFWYTQTAYSLVI